MNTQDGVEFWYDRYNMMFPPNFLHNRLSAHYIEINSIFFYEMLRKYIGARKDLLEEREACSDEVKRTRYCTNTNYVYEALRNDTPSIARIKAAGEF